jgi:hypothetical protein
MARETLTEIITEIRRSINDNSASPIFTADDVQAILDRNRLEVCYLELTRLEKRLAGGGSDYRIFTSNLPFWERNALFYDAQYNLLTPDAAKSDWLIGRWEFETSQNGAVYLSGFCFDFYAAAADALESWAAKEKLNFDFYAHDQSYKESQKTEMLLALANEMRRKATFSMVGSAGIVST